MQYLDTSHLELEALSFVDLIQNLPPEDMDISDKLIASLRTRAKGLFGPYVCGLESELCLGFDALHVAGDPLNSPDNNFAGQYRGVSSLVVVPGEPLVPSVFFEPLELDTRNYPDEFDSVATLYPRVAVPLVGVPFTAKPLGLT